MIVRNLSFSQVKNHWESEPLKCVGGDIRVRVHKTSLYPVEILVSIDGQEEYLRHDDFGMEQHKCEITLEGVMEGQFIKFRSRSEFQKIKIMEN